MTTIGSLFTGYGGLDMGVAMAVDPDAQAANPNYPPASSNGSWDSQTATSPAPTWASAANTSYDSSATASYHSKPRSRLTH